MEEAASAVPRSAVQCAAPRAALCGHVYGYVAPPAPAIFIDWTALSPTVMAALQSFIRTKEMRPPRGLPWSAPETIDYVHRVTVIFHERRHVYDLLGTVVGNHLMLSSLALAVHMFTNAKPTPPIAIATCPDYVRLCARTVRLFEASALLCQLTLVASFIDRRDSEALATRALMLSYMEREPARLPYNDFLRALAAVVSRFEPTSKAIFDVSLLVLAMMCEEPADVDDEHLLTVLRFLANESTAAETAARELHDQAHSRWERAVQRLANIEAFTTPWYARIEHDLRGANAPIARLTRDLLDDFTTHARETQARIVADPEAYINPLSHLGAEREFVQPLIFRTEGDQIPVLTDAVADLRYVRRDAWLTFIYALGPAMNIAIAPSTTPERALFRAWLTQHGIDPAAFGV